MPEIQLINKQFGPYIILKQLGIGGMAETCLAIKQNPLGARKFVALKCILPHYNNHQKYVQMFYHEAGLGLWMHHPNVIETWDVVQIDQRHTMVMEYLNGVTLDEILKTSSLKNRPIPIEVAVWIAVTILDALEYLHKLRDLDGTPLRVVHRDVSPQNIFACYDGQCKIFDMGVACSALDNDVEQQGMLVGKYAYMSPEQCHGNQLDGRSDIFALAIVLYEMTTGQSLFARDNDIRTLDAVNNADIPSPVALRADFPSFLSKIIMKGLERDIQRRYQSAREFAEELRTFMKISGYPQTQFALSKYLAELFEDSIAQNEAFIAKALDDASQKFPPPELTLGDQIAHSLFDDSHRYKGKNSQVSFSKLPTINEKPIVPVVSTTDVALDNPQLTHDNPQSALAHSEKLYKILSIGLGILFILTLAALIIVKSTAKG